MNVDILQSRLINDLPALSAADEKLIATLLDALEQTAQSKEAAKRYHNMVSRLMSGGERRAALLHIATRRLVTQALGPITEAVAATSDRNIAVRFIDNVTWSAGIWRYRPDERPASGYSLPFPCRETLDYIATSCGVHGPDASTAVIRRPAHATFADIVREGQECLSAFLEDKDDTHDRMIWVRLKARQYGDIDFHRTDKVTPLVTNAEGTRPRRHFTSQETGKVISFMPSLPARRR